MDLSLTGDSLEQDFIDLWKNGITDIWNNEGNPFTVVDATGEYPLLFDVSFDSLPMDADYVINVIDNVGGEDCQMDALNWCTFPWGLDRADIQDESAAHEYGHLIGLYDEYSAGVTKPGASSTDICEPVYQFDIPLKIFFLGTQGSWCDSLMSDFGPIQERYLTEIVKYIGDATERPFVLGNLPGQSYPFAELGPDILAIQEPSIASAVSEPETISMVILSLIALRFTTQNGRLRRPMARTATGQLA